ncbi:DIRIGENT PROTEIN [Salix koriyanagi]|uniref:Dirigent protein n=1 Tax=Salix koriyanagi TaxID=2511006 RepID=A0A9Q0Q9F6_9ROSI|nr:DIRIGENT PROTEIN [Salix koriyanagi]
MAYFPVQILALLYFPVFLTFCSSTNGKFSEQSPVIISPKRMEKMTRLRFYFHDIPSGKNPTKMRIAGPPKTAADSFGSTFMVDSPLTEEPEPTSKLVGRAQGMYSFASQHDAGLLMVLSFAFLEGTYNGSALSILGRSPVLDNVKEMPIVGGSGLFRFARGYSLSKTVSFSQKNQNAVVEYNVTVVHF